MTESRCATKAASSRVRTSTAQARGLGQELGAPAGPPPEQLMDQVGIDHPPRRLPHGGASPARVVSRRRPPTTVAAGGPCATWDDPGIRLAAQRSLVHAFERGRTPDHRLHPELDRRQVDGRARGGQRGRIVSLVLGPEALRDVEGRWLGERGDRSRSSSHRSPSSIAHSTSCGAPRAPRRFAGEAGDLADRALADGVLVRARSRRRRRARSTRRESPRLRPSPRPCLVPR